MIVQGTGQRDPIIVDVSVLNRPDTYITRFARLYLFRTFSVVPKPLVLANMLQTARCKWLVGMEGEELKGAREVGGEHFQCRFINPKSWHANGSVDTVVLLN